MKRKQFLALLLAGILGFSPMTAAVYAETETPVSETAAEDAAETTDTDAQSEETSGDPAGVDGQSTDTAADQETPQEESSQTAPAEATDTSGTDETNITETVPVQTGASDTETPDTDASQEPAGSAENEQSETVSPTVTPQADRLEEPEIPADDAEVKDDDSPIKVMATEVKDGQDGTAITDAITDGSQESFGGEDAYIVIKVSGTVTINETIAIPAGIKVAIITEETGGSAVLKRGKLDGPLFTVAGEKSILTFLGSDNSTLKIDGGLSETASVTEVKGSLITLGEGSRVNISGNVTLTGNKTKEANGGAITNDGGELVLDGGTFTDNQGKYGAVYTNKDVILGTPSTESNQEASRIVFENNTDENEQNCSLFLAGESTELIINGPLTDTKVPVSFENIASRVNTEIVKSNQSDIPVADMISNSTVVLDDIEAHKSYYLDTDGVLKKKYTLTFDSNGGSGVNPVTEKAGTAVTLENPSRSGYLFEGWFDAAGNKAASPYTISSDTVLTARWTKVYTVTFDSKGGTAIDSLTVKDGVSITLTDPTRSGYVFEGWLNVSGNKVSSPYTVDSDVTLAASWTKLYTVTFESNGGSKIDSRTVKDGTEITLTAPTYQDHYFLGWFENKNLKGDAVGNKLKVVKDLTLYAKWSQETHTLSFDSNGGSSIPAQTVYVGQAVDLSQFVPTREGFNFIGWFTSKIEDNKAKKSDALDEISIDKDTKLYAAWIRKPIISDVLNSTITGLEGVLEFGLRITKDGKVQGDSVNFTAVGAGTLEITSPIPGDERWVPICWNMDPSKYNSYTNSQGVLVNGDRRDADKNGKYTLTLNPTKAAIDSYLKAAKQDPALLESPDYFGSASNPKTKAAVYVYFRRQVYEEGTGWVDKEVKYIKKPLRYYMVLEKEDGEKYTREEIHNVVSTGGGVEALANENDVESTGSSTADGARTADDSPIGALSLLLAASFLTGCGIIYRKKKTQKVKNRK